MGFFIILLLLLLPLGSVHSATLDAKQNCLTVLKSLGYDVTKHTFEEAGWITRAKHIFNDNLVCYVNQDKSIHSIGDDGVDIVKDGFFGKDALAKRDALETERDKALEEAKGRITKEFEAKIQKVKEDSEPAATTEARKARAKKATETREAEEKRVAKEKAAAEETKRKAEELTRKKRLTEIAKIKARTGSTVSLDIKGKAETACADLLAGHVQNIDVHKVKSESFWGGKYTVWYRDRDTTYSPDQYNTRKCQIKGGSVRILSVFQSWE